MPTPCPWDLTEARGPGSLGCGDLRPTTHDRSCPNTRSQEDSTTIRSEATLDVPKWVVRYHPAERPVAGAAEEGWRDVLTGELRSQIDRIWNDFWSGATSNPLKVIEQIRARTPSSTPPKMGQILGVVADVRRRADAA